MKSALVVIVFCLISFGSFSQITLEHTFSPTMYTPTNTNNQTMYYSFDATTSILTIYDNNYSLYKSLTITPPTGFKTPSLQGGISTKIFNNDDLVEFCFSFITTSTTNPYESKMLLYNENLQILKDFGNRVSLYIFKTMDNITKCSVTGYTFNGSQFTYYQDIYHLPGNLPVGLMEGQLVADDLKPFPNPARSSVLIPISLSDNESSLINFYNQNGQLINSFPISGHESQFIYDVKSLAPGLYVYQYKNVSGKFIVQ